MSRNFLKFREMDVSNNVAAVDVKKFEEMIRTFMDT